MSEYKDYNWTEDRGKTAHSYLYSDLKDLIGNPNRKILDVGCGNGLMANQLIDEGYVVYGIDGAESGIRIANKRHKDHFYIQDLSSDDLPTELQHINFDTIISTEVIEHLYDPRKCIEFCKNILIKNEGG